MEGHLENTIALLQNAPAALNALLRGLPKAWTETNEGQTNSGRDTWSPTMVVAHLVHGEHEDWIPRAKLILQSGEAQPFVRFDREGHVRYSRGKTMEQLLDEFAQARAKSLDELRALKLTAEDLQRKGRHPALGVVTLSQLLATWAAHDLTHLHQISRIMAYQYRETVGPWSKFLGVMHCAGHSEPA
jgi:DinB superfamily